MEKLKTKNPKKLKQSNGTNEIIVIEFKNKKTKSKMYKGELLSKGDYDEILIGARDHFKTAQLSVNLLFGQLIKTLTKKPMKLDSFLMQSVNDNCIFLHVNKDGLTYERVSKKIPSTRVTLPFSKLGIQRKLEIMQQVKYKPKK